MTSDEPEFRNRRHDDGYRPRDRNDRRSDGERSYRPRDHRGSDDGRRRDRGYSSRDDRRSDDDRPRRDYHGSGEGHGYGHERGPRDDRRHDDGYRPRRDGEGSGDRQRYGRERGTRDSDRAGGDRPRYRDDRRGGRGFGGRGQRDGRERRSYGDRDRVGGRREDRGYRERPSIYIPEDVTEVLHKGIDCEINGRSDLAQILYLHGASKLNGGCEKNLLRMMKDAGKDQFPTIRGRLRKDCPEEIMPVFDYLCSTLDPEYDTASIRTSAESGNMYAIHCLIRMDAVDADDALIDSYAESIYKCPSTVTKGLEVLVRKKSSPKAQKYLDDYASYLKTRDSVKVVFPRAMKGDEEARKELNRLADHFPEAKFLEGYIMAVQDGNGEEYLKNGARKSMQFIAPNFQNLKLEDTPFRKYLAAMVLQAKGEQWVPAMVEAVKAGSEEAMGALETVQDRRSVKKSLESYYLAKGDVENLVAAFDGRDSKCLEKYCNGDPAKILEVGKMLGGNAEVDWLSKCYRSGCTECRDALVEIASDSRRYGKPLLYALHDSGAEMEAAKLYFAMGDDPSVPSVKWLQKVCRDEEAKEYVRSRFEEMGDTETFDYIFEDDGYVPRSMMKRERKSQDRRRY